MEEGRANDNWNDRSGQPAGIGIRETSTLVTDNFSRFVPHHIADQANKKDYTDSNASVEREAARRDMKSA